MLPASGNKEVSFFYTSAEESVIQHHQCMRFFCISDFYVTEVSFFKCEKYHSFFVGNPLLNCIDIFHCFLKDRALNTIYW